MQEAARWPDDLCRFGDRVRLPVRFTFADHERLWVVGEEHFAALRAVLVRSFRVDIAIQRGAGHDVEPEQSGACLSSQGAGVCRGVHHRHLPPARIPDRPALGSNHCALPYCQGSTSYGEGGVESVKISGYATECPFAILVPRGGGSRGPSSHSTPRAVSSYHAGCLRRVGGDADGHLHYVDDKEDLVRLVAKEVSASLIPLRLDEDGWEASLSRHLMSTWESYARYPGLGAHMIGLPTLGVTPEGLQDGIRFFEAAGFSPTAAPLAWSFALTYIHGRISVDARLGSRARAAPPGWVASSRTTSSSVSRLVVQGLRTLRASDGQPGRLRREGHIGRRRPQ